MISAVSLKLVCPTREPPTNGAIMLPITIAKFPIAEALSLIRGSSFALRGFLFSFFLIWFCSLFT